jgi:hypothetical protein
MIAGEGQENVQTFLRIFSDAKSKRQPGLTGSRVVSLYRKWLFLEVKINDVLTDSPKLLTDRLVIWVRRVAPEMLLRVKNQNKAVGVTVVFR